MEFIELVRQLKAEGYEFIAHGQFSEVYAKPSGDEVIKIGRRMDAGYVWADYSLGSTSPHVPRVKEVKRHRGACASDDFYSVRMERLEPVEYLSGEEGKTYERLCDTLRLKTATFYSTWRAFEPMEIPASLEDLVTEIKGLAQQRDFGLDFYPKNVMRRKDGTLVVTDPVYGYLGGRWYRD